MPTVIAIQTMLLSTCRKRLSQACSSQLYISVEAVRSSLRIPIDRQLQALQNFKLLRIRPRWQHYPTFSVEPMIHCGKGALCFDMLRKAMFSDTRQSLVMLSAVMAVFLLQRESSSLPEASDLFVASKSFISNAIQDLHKEGQRRFGVIDVVAHDDVSSEGVPNNVALQNDVVRNETLFVCGKDRRFRPTLIARPCMHRARTREASLVAVQECMETVRETFDNMPPEKDQFLVLYDLGGAGYENFDLVFARALVPVLVDTYPDRLRHVLVFNGPWGLRAAWSTISRLLHPETRQKVIFCDSTSLLQYVDDDHPYLQYLLQLE